MLSRIVPVARSATNTAAGLQMVRCMSGYAPTHWKTAREVAISTRTTIDDLPVPSGSWQENYNKKNSKWNMGLIGSMIVLVGSFAFLIKSGSLFLNAHPKMK